jgi:hypothetical protein
VRAELERILESPHFAAADRARKFLRYLVEQTLDDKAQRLKEYTIAVEVFDRDESFDPVTNPSVRVEASRLRRRLELYYLTLGREDPVLIEVPRGSYVPTFRPQADVLHLREAVSALPSALPLDELPAFAVGLSGAPTIAILPFASLDGGDPISPKASASHRWRWRFRSFTSSAAVRCRSRCREDPVPLTCSGRACSGGVRRDELRSSCRARRPGCQGPLGGHLRTRLSARCSPGRIADVVRRCSGSRVITRPELTALT